MTTGTFLRAIKKLPPLLCWTIVTTLAGHSGSWGAAEPVAGMRGYCNLPPLPGFTVKPNLLLMIDNSASMFDPAYRDPANYCLDDATETFARQEGPYLGYFHPATVYRYVFAKDAGAGDYFEPTGDAAIPKSSKCNAIADDNAKIKNNVCVNVTSGAVDNFLASGSFLNWLTMSKLDIEKMALTGGKFDTAAGMLQGETRGCQGKRFIKMLGDTKLTFALRGPLPEEGDYLYQGSMGGKTRVEIYPARYNKDACLGAVTAWQTDDVAQLKTRTDACMGNEYDALGVPNRGMVFSQIMADCYSYLASSPRDDALLEDQKLFSDCSKRIKSVYSGNPWGIPVGSGEDVCGVGMLHRLTIHEGFTFSSGFLGACYFRRFGAVDPSCGMYQVKDYCSEMENPTLTDPSASANRAGTDANVPGYILDAGIYNLGVPPTTLHARVKPASPPTGLIQEFSDSINFGAMVFNHNGAGSECGAADSLLPCPMYCQSDPAPQRACHSDEDCMREDDVEANLCINAARMDGGRIISYLNHSSLGDHTPDSGLIASIDAVSAQSWTPLSEAFYEAIGYFASNKELRLQDADFDTGFPPSMFSCQKNNILMLTDGMSTTDRAQKVREFVAQAVASWSGAKGMPASKTTTDPAAAAPPYKGSYNLDDLAWVARNKNITDFSKPIEREMDYLSTYVVYTGETCAGCADGDETVPQEMMELVASKGGGRMLTAQKPEELSGALRKMLQLIGAGANSATDSSILATGDGNGALFLQEQFHRSKSFDGGGTWVSWIGEMQGLWYFIDPFIASSGGASAIREDTGGLKELDLKRDRVVSYLFDQGTRQPLAQLLLDANGDGNADPSQPTGYPLLVSPDAVESLWRAGRQLWQRDASDRTIYTHTDGRTLIGFTRNQSVPSYLDPSRTSVQRLLQAGGEAEAQGIISFVQGSDGDGTRDRKVKVEGGAAREWKLGDIVSSTPVLQSAVSLGSYQLGSPRGYGDTSYRDFIDAKAYRERGTVYVGANDGMLHAFNLGRLRQKPEGTENWPPQKKAVLEGKGVGEENWAFVPKNVLPYLRYLSEPLYPHLYYVDGGSTIADVSIGDPDGCSQNNYWNCPKDKNSWRTVLIGSMGLGGASRPAGADCAEGMLGACVKSPLADAGLSSYFALDVTGQTADGSAPPRLLWEFSHPEMGYSTSGAAIIKINAQAGTPPKDDTGSNGRWFALFASGPTGPLDPVTCRFLGRSGQNLQLFVVDLNSSAEQGKSWVIDTGITNAFGGNISRAGIDTDKWNPSSKGYYEDDALYIGYSRQTGDGSWTGGVLRLLTFESPDPRQWKVSRLIDGVGPVTGAVTKLQDRQKKALWLYFGTGRYFHTADDPSAPRAVFGVKEPCYGSDNALKDDGKCTAAPLTLSDLDDMTKDPEDGLVPVVEKGWWIGLDGPGASLGSERFTASPAPLTSGAVFFTTFKPSLDACRQGESYLWGVAYDTGGNVAASLQGKALIPLSNGSSSDFPLSGLTERGKRRSQGMPGKPGGVKLITNSGLKPLKKIIHIQER